MRRAFSYGLHPASVFPCWEAAAGAVAVDLFCCWRWCWCWCWWGVVTISFDWGFPESTWPGSGSGSKWGALSLPLFPAKPSATMWRLWLSTWGDIMRFFDMVLKFHPESVRTLRRKQHLPDGFTHQLGHCPNSQQLLRRIHGSQLSASWPWRSCVRQQRIFSICLWWSFSRMRSEGLPSVVGGPGI